MSRIQIIALLCCAMLLAAPTLGRPQVEGIHVSGRGEVLVIPDMARVTLRVTRDGQDAVALKKELDDVTRKVLSLTRSLKIEGKDVTAAVVNIQPRYRRGGGQSVIDGVTASRTIAVVLRDLDRYGQLMNGALELGVNSVSGTELDTSERQAREEEALALAMGDARTAADVGRLALESPYNAADTLSAADALGLGDPATVIFATLTPETTPASAAALTGAAEDGNAQADAVASATSVALENVRVVATAITQLAASIADVDGRVADAAQIAQSAASAARDTDASVQELSSTAQKIGDVVQLIRNIASQTNLLALNATIEAARAGEMGRGFAVVAGEVKALASQTATATEEIVRQIGAMQGATDAAVLAIRDITETIARLEGMTAAVSNAASEQSQATQNIADAVKRATAGVEDASRHAESVRQGAGRTRATADAVSEATEALTRRGNAMQEQVGVFLGSLRVA